MGDCAATWKWLHNGVLLVLLGPYCLPQDMEPDDMGPDGEEEEGGGANAAMWEQGGVLDAAATQTQAGIIEPTQVDGDTAAPEAAAAKRIPLTYSRIKLLLAILNAELCLARKLTAALPEVESQLASDSAGVIESAIKLLTLLRRVGRGVGRRAGSDSLLGGLVACGLGQEAGPVKDAAGGLVGCRSSWRAWRTPGAACGTWCFPTRRRCATPSATPSTPWSHPRPSPKVRAGGRGASAERLFASHGVVISTSVPGRK